jgi:hypothetical protein
MILPPDAITDLAQLKKVIADHQIDFFDFGCSAGAGMAWIKTHTGYRGLGFDLNEKKLALADEAGCLCTKAAILEIPEERLVSFVSMLHLLEHLYSRTEAYDYINKACSVAREQVIIRQPFFDADQLLFADGFKTYYSHWLGHKNHMVTTDFFYHLRDLKSRGAIKDFLIGYKRPITSSADECIHSLESPINSTKYNKEQHPHKKHYIFPYSVFYEIIVAIDLSGQGYGKVINTIAADRIVFDSKDTVRLHALQNSLTDQKTTVSIGSAESKAIVFNEKHIETEQDKHRARLDILQQAKFCNEDFELSLLFDHRWYSLKYLVVP